MDFQQVKEVFSVISKDRLNKQCAFFVFVIVASSVLISYSLMLLLGLMYVTGIFSCFLLVKYRNHKSTTFSLFLNFYKGNIAVSKPNKKIERPCSVCDDSTCRRHKTSTNSKPWKDLTISEDLNDAIEQFFQRILQDFVSDWYENLSNNQNFIEEIRYALKFSTATFIRQVLELDLPCLISKKLVPCAIKHIDDYNRFEQIAKLKNTRLNEVIVEYLGKRLHPAATNRKNEISYLRELSGELLPFVLPNKYQNCRNFSVLFQEIVTGWVLLPLMDLLANPDTLNSLIITAFNYKSKGVRKTGKSSSKKVEYLKGFTKSRQNRNEKSIFHCDLNKIREDTALFYTFMKFLKNEQHVHLLQFCLDFDEFNNKLMIPESRNLDELYNEAKMLHREYISKSGPNFVECSEEISGNLAKLLDAGIVSVAEVKVSGPLIQAYKEVFDNLEENWLPLFFESDEFYSFLCGARIGSNYNGNSKKSRKIYEGNVGTSKLRRLKLALKAAVPVEGAIFYPQISENSKQSAFETEEIPVITTSYNYDFFRDISTWDVSITSYVSLNKVIYFHINVKRPNSLNSGETHRVVLRKDQDFFTLKAKLCEFHGDGEISDSPLPARRAGSDIGARTIGYERFLKKLLSNSTLRGSDLLYTFLTIEEDFSVYISTFCGAPVQDLGNVYQNVAQKLRKEKGQHLDHFMNVFLSSTSTGSDKTCKNATEIGDEVELFNVQYTPLPKTYRNHVFNDNFGVSLSKLKRSSAIIIVVPENFVESLFYLGKNVFNVPNIVLKLYVAISTLFSEVMESMWNIFLLRQLKYGLSEPHLEFLVKFLLKVIFDEQTPVTPSKLGMEQRKREVEHIFENIRKKFPYKLLGNNFLDGIVRVWKIVQHPHYNKQLVYQLLDIILLELYPSINQVKVMKTDVGD